MLRKGFIVPFDFQERPECGIHMSLSRDPSARTSGPTLSNYSTSNVFGWTGRKYH